MLSRQYFLFYFYQIISYASLASIFGVGVLSTDYDEMTKLCTGLSAVYVFTKLSADELREEKGLERIINL